MRNVTRVIGNDSSMLKPHKLVLIVYLNLDRVIRIIMVVDMDKVDKEEEEEVGVDIIRVDPIHPKIELVGILQRI
jgi:hypothetical protein